MKQETIDRNFFKNQICFGLFFLRFTEKIVVFYIVNVSCPYFLLGYRQKGTVVPLRAHILA